MKHHNSKYGSKSENIDTAMKKKNMQRLGGTGLSLEAFANSKSINKHYNPAFKKKQREFYKNAKHVSKYKKSLKQQDQPNNVESSVRPQEDQVQTEEGSRKRNTKNQNQIQTKKGSHKRNTTNQKKRKPSMEVLYEKKREEEEKARLEREAMIQAKKEEREKAEARRKASREKMFKKTRHGQPVMKYRIEHLLETIQGTSKNCS